MGKKEWNEYMDEARVVVTKDGEKPGKNRDLFFYPYEDRSAGPVARFVHEQRRIRENITKECQSCHSSRLRKLMSFDDRTGRRHVFSTCSDCGHYIGYESNVPNPDNRMPFGIYRGKMIRDILSFDPGYIRWFIKNNIEGDPSNEGTIEAMEVAMDENSSNYEKRPYVIPPESFLRKLEEEAL